MPASPAAPAAPSPSLAAAALTLAALARRAVVGDGPHRRHDVSPPPREHRQGDQAAHVRRGEPLAGPDAAAMPYTNGSQDYAHATTTGHHHPSLPNYLAIAGGSTFGVTNDSAPAYHKLQRADRVRPGAGGRQDRQGVRRRDAEQLLRPRRRHSTSPSTTPGRTSPRARSAPAAPRGTARCKLAADITNGALPNAGMVVPNLCHDAHDCSLATADAWFKTQMLAVMAGPDWKAGRLAVVLTADEDDRNSGNRVLTVVIQPSQHAHVVVDVADALLPDPALLPGHRLDGRTCATRPPPRTWRPRSGSRSPDARRPRRPGL